MHVWLSDSISGNNDLSVCGFFSWGSYSILSCSSSSSLSLHDSMGSWTCSWASSWLWDSSQSCNPLSTWERHRYQLGTHHTAVAWSVRVVASHGSSSGMHHQGSHCWIDHQSLDQWTGHRSSSASLISICFSWALWRGPWLSCKSGQNQCFKKLLLHFCMCV